MDRHTLVEHIKDGSRGHILRLWMHREVQWARVAWLAGTEGNVTVTLLREIEVRDCA